MVMLVVDTFVYLAVYWYVSNVRPGEYGIPKVWLVSEPDGCRVFAALELGPLEDHALSPQSTPQ